MRKRGRYFQCIFAWPSLPARRRKCRATRFHSKNRARLVLKPNDDYGGHDVYVGARLHDAAWENALTTALAGDYVVEEAIEPRAEEFPVFNDTEWAVSADVCGHESISIFRKRLRRDGPTVELTYCQCPLRQRRDRILSYRRQGVNKVAKNEAAGSFGEPELTHSVNISFRASVLNRLANDGLGRRGPNIFMTK
jgi:hypothetical protein